jgi:hypothetical protein
MCFKLTNWLQKISTGPLTLACLLVFLIFGALVLPDQAAKAEAYSSESGSPDTSIYYTASDLYRMAEAYGPAGRSAYIRARFTFDLIFPLVYTAFLVTAISWLFTWLKLPNRWQWINLLPIAGALFDYLENISAAIVLARYPNTTIVIDHLSGAFTLVKWIFIIGSFLTLVVLIGIVLISVFQKHQPTEP